MSPSTYTARAIALAMAMLLSSITMAQSTSSFVPVDFRIPESLETKEFRLRIGGEVEQRIELDFEQLAKLGTVDVTADVHCVTGWRGRGRTSLSRWS